jgi:hypothetical protein
VGGRSRPGPGLFRTRPPLLRARHLAVVPLHPLPVIIGPVAGVFSLVIGGIGTCAAGVQLRSLVRRSRPFRRSSRTAPPQPGLRGRATGRSSGGASRRGGLTHPLSGHAPRFVPRTPSTGRAAGEGVHDPRFRLAMAVRTTTANRYSRSPRARSEVSGAHGRRSSHGQPIPAIMTSPRGCPGREAARVPGTARQRKPDLRQHHL